VWFLVYSQPIIPGLRHLQDIVALIKCKPEGIKTKDLSDAYAGVANDLQALRQHAEVHVMYINTPKEVFFYGGDYVDCFNMESTFRECWQTTPLPGMIYPILTSGVITLVFCHIFILCFISAAVVSATKDIPEILCEKFGFSLSDFVATRSQPKVRR
jgi:hypothetical protein